MKLLPCYSSLNDCILFSKADFHSENKDFHTMAWLCMTTGRSNIHFMSCMLCAVS